MIASKIKTLRNDQGLSLGKVAEKLGLSSSLLSQIENDRVTPSIATLFKIANFLGKKTRFSLDHMIDRQPARSSVVRKTERTLSRGVRAFTLKMVSDLYRIGGRHMFPRKFMIG